MDRKKKHEAIYKGTPSAYKEPSISAIRVHHHVMLNRIPLSASQ